MTQTKEARSDAPRLGRCAPSARSEMGTCTVLHRHQYNSGAVIPGATRVCGLSLAFDFYWSVKGYAGLVYRYSHTGTTLRSVLV